MRVVKLPHLLITTYVVGAISGEKSSIRTSVSS
jgi:hypothetical protein